MLLNTIMKLLDNLVLSLTCYQMLSKKKKKHSHWSHWNSSRKKWNKYIKKRVKESLFLLLTEVVLWMVNGLII